jgi:hypothetical protein
LLDRRLDCVNSGQRCSRGKLENNSRKLRDLTKNRYNELIKKVTFSQGMMTRGDDGAVYDDAVRTSVSQTE